MQRMYVLLRKNLKSPNNTGDSSFKAAQACHAVAQFMIEHGPCSWDNGNSSDPQNGYLILLQVDDEEELLEWQETFEWKGSKTSLFREPDMNNEVTVMAVLTEPKNTKRLELLQL